jgi:hypothetical protein
VVYILEEGKTNVEKKLSNVFNKVTEFLISLIEKFSISRPFTVSAVSDSDPLVTAWIFYSLKQL